MTDALDPASNPYIRVEDGEVFLADPVIAPVMDVQRFLESKGSGLAKVAWRTGPLGIKKMTAAKWIEEIARRYRIRPQYILTVLQSEQGLVLDPVTRDPEADIKDLDHRSESVPPVPAGYTARRNGRHRTKDNNWWFALKGDWKMAAAAGAGIPDPGIFPPWDVRKYIGFANQVEWIGKLTDKYFSDFEDARRRGDLAARTVTLYGGKQVIAGDPETYALLKWTPSPKVLVQRPQVNKVMSA